METWVPVLGFTNYEVSCRGKIRNRKTMCLRVLKCQTGNYPYISLGKNSRCFKLLVHRVVWESFNGPIPEDKVVDHIDQNKLNPSLDNLRLCSRSENTHRYSRPNKTGRRGVYKNGSGYAVKVGPTSKRIYLGTFATPEDAAKAYNQKAKELFGEFAILNEV